MKLLFFIVFFFTTLISQAQIIQKDLADFKKLILPNGLTIITVNTKQFEYLSYKIIFDYNPEEEPSRNSVQFLAEYLNLNQNGKTQLYTTKVSDTNAIDSMFRFIKNLYFEPTFDYELLSQKKKIIRQRLLFQKETFLGHRVMSNYFCFGKNNIYSNHLESKDLDAINSQTLQSLYINNIKPSKTTIIVVGQISADSVQKYAENNFSHWRDNQYSSDFQQVNEVNETIIHFQDDTSNYKFSLSYPIDYFYTEKDFFIKTLLFQLFENKISNKLNSKIKNLILEYKPEPFANNLFLYFEAEPKNLELNTITIVTLMRDMLINIPSEAEMNEAKKTVISNFNNSLKNPYNIAQYAYLLNKYALSYDYFAAYANNIQNINPTQLAEVAKTIFKPDNASIFVQGQTNSLICQLHFLAKYFKVEFYDKYLYKYKIINKGFDSQYIIDDFIKTGNISKEIKNLTIKFSVQYLADTIYNSKGIIYKKYPDFYYYKNQLIINNDTLLQKLEIANKKHWLQQSAINYFLFKNEDDFWNTIYKTSIFPELFYDKLKYTHKIICDSALIKKNIFKIKVTTPDDFIIYNYYDLSTKEKTRTEKIKINNDNTDTLEVIEFFDYKKISDKSNIKIPFTIHEKTNGFKINIKIDAINDKTKLKKSLFYIDLEKLSPN